MGGIKTSWIGLDWSGNGEVLKENQGPINFFLFMVLCALVTESDRGHLSVPTVLLPPLVPLPPPYAGASGQAQLLSLEASSQPVKLILTHPAICPLDLCSSIGKPNTRLAQRVP